VTCVWVSSERRFRPATESTAPLTLVTTVRILKGEEQRR
jgi:hypothetical protein